MESTSDFERLLLLYKTEGKGISLEQYNINNGVIAPLIDGTTSGKNETALYKYLNRNVGELLLFHPFREDGGGAHIYEVLCWLSWIPSDAEWVVRY